MLMRTAEPERTAPGAGAALAIAVVGAATILGAYYFEYVLHYQPCPLCLEQRIPYYVAIPLALFVTRLAMGKTSRNLVVGGLVLLAVVMLVGAGLGIYHSGVEWRLWLGPQDCTGDITNFGGAGGLLDKMQSTSIVRCDQASRFLGVSLANANVVVSLALAAVAAWGIRSKLANSRV